MGRGYTHQKPAHNRVQRGVAAPVHHRVTAVFRWMSVEVTEFGGFRNLINFEPKFYIVEDARVKPLMFVVLNLPFQGHFQESVGPSPQSLPSVGYPQRSDNTVYSSAVCSFSKSSVVPRAIACAHVLEGSRVA